MKPSRCPLWGRFAASVTYFSSLVGHVCDVTGCMQPRAFQEAVTLPPLGIPFGHDVFDKRDLLAWTIFTLLKFFCNVKSACLCYYWGRQTTKANPVKTGDAKPWVFDTRTLWVKIARPPKVLTPVLSVGPGFHQPGLFCRMSPGHCPDITASQETLSRNINPKPSLCPLRGWKVPQKHRVSSLKILFSSDETRDLFTGMQSLPQTKHPVSSLKDPVMHSERSTPIPTFDYDPASRPSMARDRHLLGDKTWPF